MSFVKSISSAPFLERVEELKRLRPDIQTLEYMIGELAMLQWAHSIGVASDEVLRNRTLPVPPFKLRSMVADQSESLFLWTGLQDATTFLQLFQKHQERRQGKDRVLDFGCGCGRMTRFWGQSPQFEVAGTDVQADLVAWCRGNLPAVQTDKNETAPPLRYDDESFHLVYSLSVFTHLAEAACKAWLDEIGRVLAPGGIAILTTHGYPAIWQVAESEALQAMFQVDGKTMRKIGQKLEERGFTFLSYNEDVLAFADAGAEYGNCFTHESYIKEEWPKAGFEVLEFLPGGLRGWQDVTVLKRVAG